MSDETARGAPARDPGPDKGIPEEGVQPRGKWANNREFLLSMAGGVIGLGNLWRFPYLCYKNGGAVFFIPYFTLLIFAGIPMFFLETALGQYTSEGGVTAWKKICPMFQGVGIASQVIVTYLNTYYIVILAWAIFYLYNSFKDPLPWSTCDNVWNTELCHRPYSHFANPSLFHLDSDWSFLNNITLPDYFENISDINGTDLYVNGKSSEEEYWLRRVLRVSDSMSLTNVHWDLALCLLIAWILCYLCLCMGIKSMGKVVYFTATFPFLLLFIFFIRGVTLPGAAEGLMHYMYPDFHRIADPAAWYDAGTQVLFSFGICLGVLTALGSYNKYNYNCYRDCLILCGVSSATSIFAGLVVFSVLGFLAHELNLPISDVASSGLGIAFVSFPNALSRMPLSSFWAVLFFLMLIFLALDTQFVCVESLATAIADMFPRHLRKPENRELLVPFIAAICFLLGLPFITEGGIVLFHVIDSFGVCDITMIIIACVETIVIGWVYGADRFYDNIEDMIGSRPFPVLKYCWLFVTPFICGIMLLYGMTVNRSIRLYDYVPGNLLNTVSSLFIMIPLLCIPAFVLVSLWKVPHNMTTPSRDLRQARPHKPILTLCKIVIFKAQGQPSEGVEESNEKMMMEERSRV